MVLDEGRLNQFSAARILVVGDVMLDRYWFGSVDRISPEAPVPVVAVGQTEERAGGAANVAKNVTSLGANCSILSVVGVDEAGEKITELLSDDGVVNHIIPDAKTRTTIKLRVIARNQQLIRADFEDTPNKEILENCLSTYRKVIQNHDVVVLSDYGKGGLSHIKEMIQIANEANIPVLVDPKGGDYSRYRGARLITPNLKEFEQVAGTVLDDHDMDDKAMKLLNQYGIEHLLVTLSEKGMLLYSNAGDRVHSLARAREVYDVSGAGDTVIAMLAITTALSFEPEESLILANNAAGVVVSKLGTATVSMNELLDAINRDLKE